MKKTVILIALFLLVSVSGYSQQKGEHKRSHDFKIENFVDDLSADQKKKIDDISSQYLKRISNMRSDLRAVRDSIRTLSDQYGDHTKQIFPMYEREAKIQTEISKEMYRMKLKLDKVLTREQYDTLHEKLSKSNSGKSVKYDSKDVDKDKVEAVKKAIMQKRKTNASKAKGKN